MKAVIQRVTAASVTVNDEIVSQIDSGLLVLLGIEIGDTLEELNWLVQKIANLRIFEDENGVMNRSVLDSGGDMIVVSQFTLLAQTKKGNRPSYIRAARPEEAIPLYETFVQVMSQILEKPIGKGVFGADMKVRLLNDGPVTLVMDTRNKE
ncbi:D-aminoacyl-tRNA deacylase [Robiginitalea sp.]|jgi:D-tyrosyl-tRNA(Tyr) deacylase|nr:D-aminoacyl-tRNA deacylase [Robiginitalea sp.]